MAPFSAGGQLGRLRREAAGVCFKIEVFRKKRVSFACPPSDLQEADVSALFAPPEPTFSKNVRANKSSWVNPPSSVVKAPDSMGEVRASFE
ncbi:hypothetical protein KIN20_027110 [Parelaphostrongylus tenuis]|uniref:Uncharacterized protein n=1 Tax=Parelaphostrongylus tenuis TaxID=148309 RepID=A0AAD5QYY9_PARTN|nr:hypothetical protein KIN20_027110 [Parelaphostrongylus tenuis]